MSSYFSKAREPMSSYTHFIGIIMSIVGTLALVITTLFRNSGNVRSLVSGLIFGCSAIALYTASSVYHYITSNERVIMRLRKLDHAMIYVLIAGSYTPIYLNYMPNKHGLIFTSVIWSVALVGILIKMFWMNAPRILSTGFYILMGWSILFDVNSLSSMDFGAVVLIALGGIAYTIGGVIYWLKKPNWSKTFGFHETFHVFVLIGSALHFLAVLIYIA